MQRISVVGASGYSGIELVRLLLAHDAVEVVAAGSDKWAGRRVERSSLSYVPHADAIAADADVFMLATPAEVSHDLVPQLLARGARVVDLSGAFRLRDAVLYPRFYGFEHRHPALLAEAVYGLPEIDRTKQAAARLIANPGCYATAIQLALSPLASVVDSKRFIVDAMSGVTGAGRKATEDFSFAEVANDVRAYRTLRHQHTPEIEQQLVAKLTFTPHLLPIKRGIIATCHARLANTARSEDATSATSATSDDVARAFAKAYAREAFIELAKSADDVAIKDVVGTNQCRIGWAVDGDELVVISVIDNLVKGAAGQAVQNLNLMLGLPEQAGLAGLRSFHP